MVVHVQLYGRAGVTFPDRKVVNKLTASGMICVWLREEHEPMHMDRGFCVSSEPH